MVPRALATKPLPLSFFCTHSTKQCPLECSRTSPNSACIQYSEGKDSEIFSFTRLFSSYSVNASSIGLFDKHSDASLRSYESPAQKPLAAIEHGTLSRRNCRCLAQEMNQLAPVIQFTHRAGNRLSMVAYAYGDIFPTEYFVRIHRHHVLHQHIFCLQTFRGTQHDRILFGIQLEHISRLPQSDFQTFPLSNGIVGISFMSAYLASLFIHKIPFAHPGVDIRNLLTDKITVIAFYKAHFHAFAFPGLGFKTFFEQIIPYLRFCPSPQRKQTAVENVLTKPPEKIALVLLGVIPHFYVSPVSITHDSGIMTRRYIGAIQLVGPICKHFELEQRVAKDTRIGSASLQVFIHEGSNDFLLESLSQIGHMMLYSKLLCQ